MKKIAVFPGSFSPFTIGHKSIIDKTLPIFDKIIIAIGANSEKEEMFSVNQRINWIKSVYKNNTKIFIDQYQGLTVDYCIKSGAKYIIRGLRNENDFKYEHEILKVNKKLSQDINTIFIISDKKYHEISSTKIRNMLNNGEDPNIFLPKEIKL